MKALTILFAASMSFWACTSTPDKTLRNADSLAVEMQTGSRVVRDTLCFRRLDGTASQDTTSLKLVIEGNQVSGDFVHYPFEKDSRAGTITATINDDLIKGVWTYMQEGMTDTLPVEFQLRGDKLIQKSYIVDPETGRQTISDASAFDIGFDKINCSQIR